MTTTELRVMRTYHVELTDADDAIVAATDVNLSFPLGPTGIDDAFVGQPVTDLRAWAELNTRLRKLARRHQVPVTGAQLDDDTIERSAELVRSRLVTVAIDPVTGRPVPKGAHG